MLSELKLYNSSARWMFPFCCFSFMLLAIACCSFTLSLFLFHVVSSIFLQKKIMFLAIETVFILSNMSNKKHRFYAENCGLISGIIHYMYMSLLQCILLRGFSVCSSD